MAAMSEQRASSHSFFAIWHVPRWVWFVLVPLVLAVYLLSAPLVCSLLYKTYALHESMELLRAADRIYSPAWWYREHSHLVATIHDWEWRVLGYEWDELAYLEAEIATGRRSHRRSWSLWPLETGKR